MKKAMMKYSLLTVTGLLLAACSHDEEPVVMKAPSYGGSTIDLSADVTAGNTDVNYGEVLSSFRVGDRFGVFAVEYEKDTIGLVDMDRFQSIDMFYNSSDEYIYNSLYLYNAEGGLDRTLPVPQYFPLGSTVGLAFYAYYPYNSEVSYYKGVEYGWTFKWSLEEPLKDTPDFMYSGPTFVDGDDRMHVVLNPMKHVMTAVNIYMSTTDPELAGKKLKNIQVGFTGGKSGVIHIDNGKIEYDRVGSVKNRTMYSGINEEDGVSPTLVDDISQRPSKPVVSFVLPPGSSINTLYATGGGEITGLIYPNYNIPTDALNALKAGVITSYYFNVQKRNTRGISDNKSENGIIDLEDYSVSVTVTEEKRL